MVERRECLKLTGATGLAIGLAGCTSYLPWVGGGDASDDGNGTAGEPENNGGSGTDDDLEQADGGEDDGASPTQDENKEEQTDDQEEEHETEQEETEDSGPSEEDTEIDREEYDQQEAKETEERSESDIEVEAEPQRHDDGSVTVTGTVTNVSDAPIDVVDVEIVFYGADDAYLASDLASLSTIESGESVEFEGQIGPDDARDGVERIEINPDVYDTSE